MAGINLSVGIMQISCRWIPFRLEMFVSRSGGMVLIALKVSIFDSNDDQVGCYVNK